jgi:hypothetical protein
MRSTIFLILVWAGSSTLLGSESVAVSSASHLVRTLHAWAIVAILLSVARQFLRGRAATDESASRQILSACGAFLVFALLLTSLAAVSATIPGSAALLAFAGGVVAPVITLLVLESPTLRPRGLTAGLIALACVSCFALALTLERKPSVPGRIRTEHPVKELQRLRTPAPSVA